MNVLDLVRNADWWSSDHHIGHARISELAGRPYNSVEQMNLDLLDRHNSHVRPKDVCVFVGDEAMGDLADSLDHWKRFHGIKVLVPGNHDRLHSVYRGSDERKQEWARTYADAGFLLAPEQVTVELDGLTVRVCHFPTAGDSHGEDRYAELRPVHDGTPLIHGHVHEKWRLRQHTGPVTDPATGRTEQRTAPMLNVGVDAPGNNFAPVSTERVLSLLRTPPAA